MSEFPFPPVTFHGKGWKKKKRARTQNTFTVYPFGPRFLLLSVLVIHTPEHHAINIIIIITPIFSVSPSSFSLQRI